METVISHLEELRSKLVFILISFFILMAVVFLISDELIKILDRSMPENVELVVNNPFEILLAKVGLSLFISLLALLPLLFHQAILFIKPGLKEKEKKILWFVPLSVVLFFLGFFLSFLFLLEIGIRFLAESSTSIGIKNLWSLNETISLLFIFSSILGLCFQLPLILMGLNRLGILSYEMVKKKRKFVYILMLIISAIITPTVDPITQIAVALPLILLYELSLLLMRVSRSR
jgi:sec-independent protein translocase protein TatC